MPAVPASQKNPAALGYRMPAEWAPHKATWLAWPHGPENWQDLPAVEMIYCRMIEALLPGEIVRLLVRDERERDRVLGLISKSSDTKNLEFHFKSTADVWVRDYGPTFLLGPEGGLAWCKWHFNVWGGKYKDLAGDGSVFDDPALLSAPKFEAGFVLEGGSIETNGEGTCLTTEECLLNANRNPHLTRADLEAHLFNYLGAKRTLWLKRGLAGDDTDGHVDDIARFAGPKTIVAAYEEDSTDENYGVLKENWEILERDLGKWDLVRLPMPGKVAVKGRRLPASYANFYIANGVVLIPVFGHANDERAVKTLAGLFPSRRMVPIDCRALVYGLGAIHCVTQQEPLSSCR